MIPPAPFFSLKIVWLFRVVYVSMQIVETFCSSYVKNVIGNFRGIALNLLIALCSTVIFTILIPPIHEHGIYLIPCHLCFLYSVSYSFLSTGLLPP